MGTVPRSFIPDEPQLPKSFVPDEDEQSISPKPEPPLKPPGKSWSQIAMDRLMNLAPPAKYSDADYGLPGVGLPQEGMRAEGERLASAGAEIVGGAKQVADPSSVFDSAGRAKGASRMIRGAFSGAGPYIGAVAGTMAPLATAISIPGGMAVDYVSEKGLKAAGVPEGPAELAADVLGVLTPNPGVRAAKELKRAGMSLIEKARSRRKPASVAEEVVPPAAEAAPPEPAVESVVDETVAKEAAEPVPPKVEPKTEPISKRESKEVIQPETVEGGLQSRAEELPPLAPEQVEPAIPPKVEGRAGTPAVEPEPVAKPGGVETATAEPVPLSPSYDATKGKILEKLDVPEPVRGEFVRQMEQWEAANPTRRAVTFDDIRVEAAKIDPDLIYRLRRPEAGETLDPAVRYAARETVNGLNAEIVQRRKALETEPMSADDRMLREREIDGMEKQTQQLLDVLLPTRSQDGRNLVYHRMMAEQSFDVDYWLSRARRASGLPPGESVPVATATKIRKILADGQEAETAATARIREKRPRVATEPAAGVKASPIIAKLDAIEAAARERLAQRWKSAGSTLSSGPGLAVEIAGDFAIVGAVKIARGAVKFSAWSAEMVGEFGDEIKPHLRSIWQAARKYSDSEADIKAARAELQRRPPVTSEQRVERGVNRAVTRAEAKAAGAGPKPSEWRLTPEERELVRNDPRVKAARTELAKTMSQLDRDGWIPTVIALRKAGLLTGPKTHIRNIGGNASMQVLEETQRLPAALVDYALSRMTGRRTVGAPDLVAVAKATREAATKGVSEAREIWKKGATDEQMQQFDFQRELNSGNRVIDAYVNHVFRSLGAEDRIFKVYAYERSLQEQMKLAKADQPTEAMRVQALADADFATFNNEGLAAGIGAAIRHSPTAAANTISARLEKSGQPGAAESARKAGRAMQAVFDFTVPFVRTPANIVARVIEYSGGGLVKGGTKLIQSAINQNMTAEQQRAISTSIGRGATGLALLYLGWKLGESGILTGTRQEEPGRANVDEAAGRLPGAIKIGDKWQQIGSFSPAGNLLVIGATLQRESTKGLSEEAKRPENIAKVATRTVMEQPLLQGTRDIVESIAEPGARARRAVGAAAGSLVPTIVSDVAGLADDRRRDARGKATLDAIVNSIQARLPVARNQLPERTDVLGRVEPQEKQSAINPGIGSKALEDTDRVRGELVREQVSIGTPQRRKGESEEEHRLRGQLIGLLAEAEIGRAIDTPDYRDRRFRFKGALVKGEDARREILERAVADARSAVSALVTNEGFSGAPEKRRMEILGGLVGGRREKRGETLQEFHRRIRAARNAR